MARIPPVDYREEAWKDVTGALLYEIDPTAEPPELTTELIEAHEQEGVDCAWTPVDGREGCGGCLRQWFLHCARIATGTGPVKGLR